MIDILKTVNVEMVFAHLTLEWSVMIGWKKYRPSKDIFGIITENDIQLLDRL